MCNGVGEAYSLGSSRLKVCKILKTNKNNTLKPSAKLLARTRAYRDGISPLLLQWWKEGRPGSVQRVPAWRIRIPIGPAVGLDWRSLAVKPSDIHQVETGREVGLVRARIPDTRGGGPAARRIVLHPFVRHVVNVFRGRIVQMRDLEHSAAGQLAFHSAYGLHPMRGDLS